MAIQANISSTQYGTTHDKAYIKVSKLYANYIKNTTHIEICVYNSAEDYLNNKTALYNQNVSYSQEQTDILWNNEEPINSLNEVYRMVNLELEEDIKYEGLKNLLDIEVVEEGGLSEEELKGKFLTGVFVDEEKPEYCEEYERLVSRVQEKGGG